MHQSFEVDTAYLSQHIDELVSTTVATLQSQFLSLPKGENFIEYSAFQGAYETLKKHTSAFVHLTTDTVMAALQEDSLAFVVLRTILGMTPPEWAYLASITTNTKIDQGFARAFDGHCRARRDYIAYLRHGTTKDRLNALIQVAVQYITQGAPSGAENMVHRLAKADTSEGLISLMHVAAQHIPYAVLLYERYLGRPFASHRDAVSELVGEVMESAIEERLSRARISFRKTKRAERIPGFEQAPDFLIPDEFHPEIIIEAKITEDDGTARDKVTRIIHLTEMSDERKRKGLSGFEVVACIDGRGFGIRREDMKRMLLKTNGKVFTLATLDSLIENTLIRKFLPY